MDAQGSQLTPLGARTWFPGRLRGESAYVSELPLRDRRSRGPPAAQKNNRRKRLCLSRDRSHLTDRTVARSKEVALGGGAQGAAGASRRNAGDDAAIAFEAQVGLAGGDHQYELAPTGRTRLAALLLVAGHEIAHAD